MKYSRENPYYYLEGVAGQFDTFAQTYGCGTYGAGEYDENNCETSTGGTDGNSGGGSDGLVDTGFGIILAVTIAAVLIFTTVLVMVMRRKKKQPTPVAPSPGANSVQSTPQRPVQRPVNTDIINSGKE